MENKVASVAQAPVETTPIQAVRPITRAERGGDQAAVGQDQADLRLVIEEDSGSGSYVYKTVNRVTGEVVQQFPREEVLKMLDESAYAAGDVIRTRV